MAVTFNGPLKVSRPGYTQDGITPNQGGVPNRQAWYAPVTVAQSVYVVGASGGVNVGVIPAGSQILSIDCVGFNGSASALGAGTIGVTLGGTNIASIPVTAVAAATGFDFSGVPSSAAAVATWNNTGTADATLAIGSEGFTADVSFLFSVNYIPRNTDGSLSDEGYRPFVQ